jgi:serine protease inhibitor
LTNAVYFKGAWEWEFDPNETHQGDFHVTSSQTVKTPMMSMRDARLNYAITDSFQILELPYKGDKASMLLVLPRTDPYSGDSAGLGETKLTANALNSLGPIPVGRRG